MTSTLSKPGAVGSEICLSLENVTISYGKFEAVKDVFMDIPHGRVTAFIGPSGCGKSTVLRALNRMNDLIPGCHLRGRVIFDNHDLYDPKVDPVEVRRRIGMVFQKPNPFPKTIYENIAFGARINGYKATWMNWWSAPCARPPCGTSARTSCRRAASPSPAASSSASASPGRFATEPEVILMDEPCSALDPISTLKIEETMHELKRSYTIVIVTHNMQQAVRVADMTAFFNAEAVQGGTGKVGYLVEYSETERIFNSPAQQATQDYVSGRFG